MPMKSNFSAPLIASRLFGTPLLMHPEKVQAIAYALRDKLSLDVDQPSEMFMGPGASFNRDGNYMVQNGIATIDINGTLVHKGAWLGTYSGMVSYTGIERQAQIAQKDPDVKAVLFDIHSGGGEASGCFDCVDLIKGISKPTFGLSSDMAASGAYAIISATDFVATTQTGSVGSVGVVMTLANRVKEAQMAGIDIRHFYAGAEKVLGSPFVEMTDEDAAKINAKISEMYDVFVDKVAANRPIDAQAVRGTEAAVYTAQNAINAGLADAVMSRTELLAYIASEVPGVKSRQSLKAMESKTMTVETQASDSTAELTTIKAERFEAGKKEGATLERARISEILNSDEAKGREKLANHLAFNTSDDAEKCLSALSASEKAKSESTLDSRMAASEQPEIGGAAGETELTAEQEIAALADSILNVGGK